MGLYSGVIVPAGINFLLAGFYFCFVFTAQVVFPREKPTINVHSLVFTAVYIVIAQVILWLILLCGIGGFVPLFSLQGVAGIVIGLLLADFLIYAVHRAQHAIPLLWRFHSTHHSIERLGPLAYSHITEAPIQALLVGAPLALIVADPRVGVIGLLLSIQGNYLHSTTRLHYGPFGRFIADNRSHRIHHSIEPHHYDRNFGTITLIWDRLFGTAYFSDEWPKTGIIGQPEPRSLRDYFWPPVKPREPSPQTHCDSARQQEC